MVVACRLRARASKTGVGGARGACRLAVALCVLLLAHGQGHADGFDWRARGILFRVSPPPLPAAPAGVHEAAPAAPGAGAAPAPQAEAIDVGAPSPASAAGVPMAPDGVPVAPQASDAPVPDAPDAPDAPDVPSPAGAADSFILATVHYGDAESLFLQLPRLQWQVGEARVLVNEIDLEEAWQPSYEPYRRLGEGERLRALIGARAFALAAEQLPGTPAEQLDTLKPWVVMAMLEFPSGQEQRSIDAQLQQWAADGGVRRVHLENLPDQLAALDCVPPRDYADVLRQRLENGWSFDLDAERVAGYYRQRDLAAWHDDLARMQGLTGAALVAEEEAQRCLIGVRNARWLPVLDRWLREGGAFVAVGAIHLTGDEGLLAQLQRKGYRIEVEPW